MGALGVGEACVAEVSVSEVRPEGQPGSPSMQAFGSRSTLVRSLGRAQPPFSWGLQPCAKDAGFITEDGLGATPESSTIAEALAAAEASGTAVVPAIQAEGKETAPREVEMRDWLGDRPG